MIATVRSRLRSGICAAALIGVAQCCASNATAQVAGTPTGIETVVVTAERRAENVQDIPSTMTALSAADIKTRGIRTIDDIARMVPSVNFGTFGYGTQISARGVGMNLIAGEGESSVAVQLDGIPLTRPSMLELAQTDLARVEFLLGPQGTLYGRNATAGVLNLITPTPPDSFEAGATVGAGNYGAFDANAFIGGPVTDDVTARLYVGTNSHGGYIDNLTTGGRLDGLNDQAVRLAINAKLTSSFELDSHFFYQKSNASGPIYKPIDPINALPPDTFALAPWKIKADAGYGTKLEMSGGSVLATLTLSDTDKLTSLTGYIQYNDTQHYDSDGTSLNLFYNHRPQHTSQFTQEVDYLHDDGPLQATLGAFYMLEDISDLGEVVFTPGFVPVNGLTSLGFANEKHDHNEAIFGDATYAVTPQLKIFGGLRGIWDYHSIKVTDSLNFGDVAVDLCTPADPLGNESSNTSALTGRVGTQYAVNDDSNVYGTYSRGYKSGGFNSAACGNSFAPETLDAWEIGSKNVLLDGQLLINASAFYYEFKNLQVEQVVDTQSVIDNVPKSRIYGLDLQSAWQIDSNWSADGNLSLLNARYVRFFYEDQLNPALGNQDLKGKPLNRSPDWSLNFGLQYAHPLFDGTLTVRADVYSTAQFTLAPANTVSDIQPAYTTLGGSISYGTDDGKYLGRIWVKNATNQAYLQGIFALALFGIGREGIYGDPATYGIELTRNL